MSVRLSPYDAWQNQNTRKAGATDDCTDTATDFTDLFPVARKLSAQRAGFLFCWNSRLGGHAHQSLPSGCHSIHFRLVVRPYSSRAWSDPWKSVEVSVQLSVGGRGSGLGFRRRRYRKPNVTSITPPSMSSP